MIYSLLSISFSNPVRGKSLPSSMSQAVCLLEKIEAQKKVSKFLRLTNEPCSYSQQSGSRGKWVKKNSKLAQRPGQTSGPLFPPSSTLTSFLPLILLFISFLFTGHLFLLSCLLGTGATQWASLGVALVHRMNPGETCKSVQHSFLQGLKSKAFSGVRPDLGSPP